MDKEQWGKFCQVFKLKVEVEVPKEVTRDDIILTLLKEGEFVFKQEKGHACICLDHLKGKATKEQINAFKELLWNPIENYLKKPTKKSWEGVKKLNKELGENRGLSSKGLSAITKEEK